MAELALATIAYNAPRAVSEQIRLLKKYLEDDYSVHVFDASSDDRVSWELVRGNQMFTIMGRKLHHEALNFAALDLLARDAPYIGFLDHDVYPTKPTRLIPLIEEAGFLAVGQRHAPTGHLYPWPGFVFFSREWLNGRPLDFTGIRAENPADNGDTGSGLWPLFVDEDWEKMFRLQHSYGVLREPDDYGLQSYGFERFGDWLHVTNASGWKTIPEWEERERLVYEMLAKL